MDEGKAPACCEVCLLYAWRFVLWEDARCLVPGWSWCFLRGGLSQYNDVAPYHP